MKKGYLYVAGYYDKFNNRELGISDKKIDITTIPDQRALDLHKTKGPIGIEYLKIWEFEQQTVPYTVKNDFIFSQISEKATEEGWFEDDDESILDLISVQLNGLKKLGIESKDVTTEYVDIRPREESDMDNNNRKRNPITILSILFHDTNTTIEKPKAIDTYLEFIELVGVEKVHSVIGERWITLDDDNGFLQSVKIGDYYVNTNTSTRSKYDVISVIIEELDLDVSVDIIKRIPKKID